MSILPDVDLTKRIGHMTSMMHPSRLFFTIGCFVILSVTRAAAADWPEGYIVYEESKSPDEKYAILIPSREAAENDESVGETNYLADLEPARFAVVKKEQIEWLKKRDAASSVEEKCKLTEARTKVLQELVW
jgi:hypothetical protein